jgi:hypothetical protein
VTHEASCECTKCPPSYDKQVCGSDNKTYKSECHLYAYNCKNYKNVEVASQGPCEPPPPPPTKGYTSAPTEGYTTAPTKYYTTAPTKPY